MTTIKPNNPFLIAGYYGSAYFCDKKQRIGLYVHNLLPGFLSYINRPPYQQTKTSYDQN